MVRRVDLQVGRVLDALDRVVGKGRWALALSADHGFNEIPELARRLDPGRRGGRIADGPRVSAGFTERVNRALAEGLCLAAGSEPIAALEGFSLIYDREHLPLRTVAGAAALPAAPSARPRSTRCCRRSSSGSSTRRSKGCCSPRSAGAGPLPIPRRRSS